MTTGDYLFHDKKIDLIKIDVEGMECEVLIGLQETIDANKPLIFIEIRHLNRNWFNDWMLENNYHVVGTTERNKEYENVIAKYER